MPWNKSYPVNSTIVAESTEQIRDNWQAIEDWFGVEHKGLASAGEGEHVAGKMPAMYYGGSSGAPTAAISGQLAFFTNTGQLRITRYTGLPPTYKWRTLTETYFSRVRNVAASASIPTGEWTLVTTWESTAASGLYDTLDEWNTNRFTAKAAGYYLVICHNRWVEDISDYLKAVGLFYNGVLHTQAAAYGRHTTSLWFFDVVALPANDYIELGVFHNKGSNAIISSASLHIHRIS